MMQVELDWQLKSKMQDRICQIFRIGKNLRWGWVWIRFTIGFNVRFNILFNIQFNIGLNIRYNIGFNNWFNIWVEIWFNILLNIRVENWFLWIMLIEAIFNTEQFNCCLENFVKVLLNSVLERYSDTPRDTITIVLYCTQLSLLGSKS